MKMIDLEIRECVLLHDEVFPIEAKGSNNQNLPQRIIFTPLLPSKRNRIFVTYFRRMS